MDRQIQRPINEFERFFQLVALIQNACQVPVPVVGVWRILAKALERLFANVFRVEEPGLQIEDIYEISKRHGGNVGISICISIGQGITKTLLRLKEVESHFLGSSHSKRHIGLNKWIFGFQ